MTLERPDLSKVSPEIRAYIESLERENERLREGTRRTAAPRPAPVTIRPTEEDRPESLPELDEPAEPPTSINVISMTASGMAKRTPRHLYTPQRRGGMGIFDLESPDDTPPAILAVADESQTLLLLTRMGKVYRLPVSMIPETPVRGRGASITGKLNLAADDSLAFAIPEQAEGYLALVSQTGFIRKLRHHVFGEAMKPGTELLKHSQYGGLAAACWSNGSQDLLITTRLGRAIRFGEKLVPPAGSAGVRLTDGDEAVAVTAIDDDSRVFLLGSDGKGTLRQMETFTANKAPGAGGKNIFSTNRLVAALAIDECKDVFIISHLSKIIRFHLEDIPAKDGVVQGVICMALRADEPVAAALS